MKHSQTAGPIEPRIHLIRGHKVMLSMDLAQLYYVKPKALIQAVKRNRERFPEDFMFQLTFEETPPSRSQFVTLKRGENIKHLPYAFTEQGVAMLSSVLRSRRAVMVNIAIMRAFVKIRETLTLHKELAVQLAGLDRRVTGHDAKIQLVFDSIRRLMEQPALPRKRIGFQSEDA